MPVQKKYNNSNSKLKGRTSSKHFSENAGCHQCGTQDCSENGLHVFGKFATALSKKASDKKK